MKRTGEVKNIRDVIYFISSRQYRRNGDRSPSKVSAQLGISLTSGDVRLTNVFTHLATMSFMCPLEMCVIIHIERGMIFETIFFFFIALNV